MVLPNDDCDECTPGNFQRKANDPTTIIISSLPFLLTFLFVAIFVFQALFPLLSGDGSMKDGSHGSPLLPTNFNSKQPSLAKSPRPSSRTPTKRLSAFAFSTTIALAAVLAELVLCEISDTFNPVARAIALQITVFLLLILLIVVIPSLEIHSVISAAGWRYTGSGAGKLRFAWLLHAVGFALWILLFWGGGQLLMAKHHKEHGIERHDHVVDAVVEHVGVIGISLMALLSGFASVSSPWQNFGARSKPVSEESISRKQAGLDATNDMLAAKRSRLRALEHKLLDAPSEGFLSRAMDSIRGNPNLIEIKNLQLEITGLENMALSLSTQRSLLQSRFTQQHQSQSPAGRVFLTGSYIFSIYCLYRIFTTSLTASRRRIFTPRQNFTGSDPINNILVIFVNHYDSHLDRDVWTRQISFLLSGVMLLASFSSVLQTFHFFARFTPNLLRAAQANLPLIVAQICATYVISAAILLRGIMPGQIVNDRLRGLGGTDMEWVDGWFEIWFLGGVIVTGVGIWIGRKIERNDEWDDDEDVEMGKMS